MDDSRFDRLARAFAASHTRRNMAALLATTGALSLIGLTGSDAKKKRKKKKCKAPKVKCGKKCLSATSCCTDANCGAGGFCANQTCTCFTGFRPCNGTCIAEGQCCANSDCGEGGVCREGLCRCLSGFKPCRDVCIPASQCCTSTDCGAGRVCLANGTCAKSCGGSVDCGTGCGCGSANTEGERVCVPTFGDCSAPTCDSTSQCPQGQQCQNITGCPPTRCVALCPGV